MFTKPGGVDSPPHPTIDDSILQHSSNTTSSSSQTTEQKTTKAPNTNAILKAPSPQPSSNTVAIKSTPTPLETAHKKLDRRLILWYAAVYLVMRVHVSNISNTAIINLEQGDDIKTQLGNLSSEQWAWVLSIFYYPYMFLEPVATLALKRFGPRQWMARIMISWVSRWGVCVIRNLR